MIGAFFITAVPLGILRCKFGLRITSDSSSSELDEKFQFSLQQLLALMVGFSVVFFFIPMLFPNQNIPNTQLVPWSDVTAFFVTFVVIASSISILAVAHAFVGTRSASVLIGGLIYLAVAPSLALQYLRYSAFQVVGPVALSQLAMVGLISVFMYTLYAAMLCALGLYRRAGYQYQLVRKNGG